MRKIPLLNPVLFNPRVLLAVSLCSVGAVLTMFSFAAGPASGIRTDTSGAITFAADSRALMVQPPGVQVAAPHGNTLTVGSSSSADVLPCARIPALIDKCPVWVSTFDGPGHGADGQGGFASNGRVTATSPDGRFLYVGAMSDVGVKANGQRQFDVVIVAYNAATGAQQWAQFYPGTTDLPNPVMQALAVSPNGSALFATAYLFSDDSSIEALATIALNANTGEQLWTATVPSAQGRDVTVSRDGSRAYVTGSIAGKNPDDTPFLHALTVSYDTATGQEIWRSEYSGNPGEQAFGYRTAVSADGTLLYVTGSKAQPGHTPFEVTLLVYDPLTGTLLHESHHLANTNPPSGIAVSDSRLFIAVTLNITDSSGNLVLQNALTLGFDSTGEELWSAQFGDGAGCNGTPFPCDTYVNFDGPIDATRDGSRVFVTMESFNGSTETTGFATVAYDGATGNQAWAVRDEKGKIFCIGCNGPVVQVNPNTKEVYVSGLADFNETQDITTVAYDTITGAQKWTTFTSGEEFANPFGIAVSPDGSQVFVAGTTRALGSSSDLIALAYNTEVPSIAAVVSRKIHGSAGAFDIDLPLAGSPGIECRSGGANGDYTIIFQFENPVVTCGTAACDNASCTASGGMGGNDCLVTATDVHNAQSLVITLNGVTDLTGATGKVSRTMGVLLGDVTANGTVSNTDVASIKAQVAAPVTSSNFRNDVNANGIVSNTDVSTTKAQVGASLP